MIMPFYLVFPVLPYVTICIHRSINHGPIVAVVQCPNVQLLKSGVRALDDFPCVSVPSNARDSQYQVVF